MTARLLAGDCRVTLLTLEAGSVQAVVTSPPYYCLRDYGTEPLVWGGIEHEHEWGNKRWYAAQGNGTSSAAAFSEAGPDNAARLKAARWRDNETCHCGAWRGSLGLEPSPELYLEHLLEVFREVHRVLAPSGVLFVNMGDSYAGSGKGPSGTNGIPRQSERQGWEGSYNSPRNPTSTTGPNVPASWSTRNESTRMMGIPGYKSKDLMMMPFRVAMALQGEGWWLRSVIPWVKRSAMPESVSDRPATAVEYWFMLTKSARYFWDADAVRVAAGNNTHARGNGNGGSKMQAKAVELGMHRDFESVSAGAVLSSRSFRNSDLFFQSWQGLLLDEQDDPLACVVNPAGFSGAHFATFPPKLVEPLIKASTSEKGQCPECRAPWARVTEETRHVLRSRLGETKNVDKGVPAHAGYRGSLEVATTGWRPTCAHDAQPVPQTILDPFGGSGTVALVAERLGRNAILCELSDKYAPMAADRIAGDAPMFAEVDVA